MNYIRQIIAYIRKAQEIAAQYGFKNLLQPGLVKELVVADVLGHEVHRTKHEPDAYDPTDPSRKFEYLSLVSPAEPSNSTGCSRVHRRNARSHWSA